MSYRAFHLNRRAYSIHQTLQEERHQLKAKEAYFRQYQEQTEAENKAKSLFLASVSHELRTPMNSILGFADLLKEEELTKEQYEYVEMIALSSQNLLVLVNDILDLSKIEAGKVKLSPIHYSLEELCKYIESIMRSLAGEKGIDYAIIRSGGLPPYFMADPVRVCQCLTNLISNAVKFTEKGSVHLEIQQDEHDGQMYLRFDVKDTGIGISEEQCPRIFEVFAQADENTSRKYGGTGLGLAISRKLAILMGGSIEVKSQVGIGSVFTFEIPLITQPNNSNAISKSAKAKQ
jgi:signal transduction histidine kinase